MCNNRCVFCVSGQRTARGQAGATEIEPVVSAIRAARSAGHTKITLLGGEPTLQPIFLDVLRECAQLGFEEVVVFTNGAKTAREGMIDEILATGARVSWRISIQGATEESHERTTKKDGSFGRIVRTLEHLHRKGQRISVNMCVVASNYDDVDRFAALVLPYGVRQLHLDLMRPLDAGDRTEAELKETLLPLDRVGDPFRRMVAAFPASFDVNVGNLPFCIAPEIATRIHHDGQPTETIAIDGDDKPSRPFDKYLVKARDKTKPPSCARCVFDDRCTGVYEHYVRHQGYGALVPVDAERLVAIDPERRLLALHLRPLGKVLAGKRGDVRFETIDRGLGELGLRVVSAGSTLGAALVPPGSRTGVVARYRDFDVVLDGAPPKTTALVRALAAELAALGPIVPLGDDAVLPVAPKLGAALVRLAAAAPFTPLVWTGTEVAADGQRTELVLEGPAGERVVFFVALEAGRAKSGYRLEAGEPTEAVRSGLRAAMTVLAARAPLEAAAR